MSAKNRWQAGVGSWMAPRPRPRPGSARACAHRSIQVFSSTSAHLMFAHTSTSLSFPVACCRHQWHSDAGRSRLVSPPQRHYRQRIDAFSARCLRHIVLLPMISYMIMRKYKYTGAFVRKSRTTQKWNKQTKMSWEFDLQTIMKLSYDATEPQPVLNRHVTSLAGLERGSKSVTKQVLPHWNCILNKQRFHDYYWRYVAAASCEP